ncbi:SixA phosphatase family protein [Reinekea blandensis]|uniref:Phosphohistidine phosphatase SixA n=1 Tax=Reinekea blandensis MED297 TaxID=314283 RepID=A4BEJ6_9GAMM|nr:histidine phosphatase family protein [Reinekea blandensis]EAR09423.1 phosphohistidine phosphatase SixA [Reinekea sp. MED297] [Reinekea blandensis MED297]
MMKLYLMRHGEAESFARCDADRSLTQTGRAAVASKAQLFPAIERLVVSPYLRALQTADLLVGEGMQVTHRVVDDRVTPDCPLEPVINEVIRSDVREQLIVAHNPLLSYLVADLVGNDARGIGLGTADVACLEADEWLPGCARLLWVR